MKFISLENEIDSAINAVNNEDSTDPKVVLEIANYKEELAKLKGQSSEETTDSNTEPTSTTEETAESAASGEDTGDNESGTDTEVESEELPDMEGDVAASAEAFQVYDALGLISKKLVYAKQRTGVDYVTSKMALESSEILMQRLGFPLKPGIALESGDSHTSRTKSLNTALESIEEYRKTVWETLERFARTLWKWVKEYIFGIKQKTSAQEDALKEIKDLGKDLESKLNKHPLSEESLEKLKTITYKANAHNLVNIKESSEADVLLMCSAIEKFADAYNETILKIVKDKMIPASFEFTKNDPDTNKTKLSITKSDFSGLNLDQIPGKFPEGMTGIVSSPLPGNRVLKIQCVKDYQENAIELTSRTEIYLDRLSSNGSAGAVQISSITTMDNIHKLEEYVKTLVKVVGNFVDNLERPMGKDRDAMEKTLNSDIRNWVNLDEEVIKELGDDMRKYLQISSAVTTTPLTSVLNYLSNFITALQEYIVFSTKHILNVLEKQIRSSDTAA